MTNRTQPDAWTDRRAHQWAWGYFGDAATADLFIAWLAARHPAAQLRYLRNLAPAFAADFGL